MEAFDQILLTKVAKTWNTSELAVIPGILPGGSPERVLLRAVVQDRENNYYALEGFGAGKLDKRLAQAQMLHMLKAEGCPAIAPWLSTENGEWYAGIDGYFWQLRPWLSSDALPRETYGDDPWRGETAARQLMDMKQAAGSLPNPPDADHPFMLHHYIGQVMTWFQTRNSRLIEDLIPIANELKPFFAEEHDLPIAFCHGDYHPFNILWKDNAVSGLIDREFAGMKPEAYDAANLLGCIGMDDPAWLTGPMVMDFINSLKNNNIFSPQSWHFLPDMIAALRFAWMREWVNQKNKDMIIQELDYLWLLLDNRDLLRSKWQSK